MAELVPFEVDIPEEALTDLRDRLARTRWPEAETVDDWSQGIPLAYTQELAEYWATQYDWRRIEAKLNTWDHFITEIDGLDIHFMHVRSPHEDAFPVLLTHGWPGSILEFVNLIEPLTDPGAHGGDPADAMHLVIPSLPGYGFSGKPTTTGWGVEKTAAAWDQLMLRLGYERYGAQGGDWGAIVTTAIGQHHGDHCAGIHLNMPIAMPGPEDMADLNEQEQRALAALEHYDKWDSGYSTQQRTRPQTLGYGLVDSPVGQMAWIVEKFWSWMDCDGHPENVLSKDELLDNVMIYWLNGAGASSARYYWESFGGVGGEPVATPTGVASFPKEILQTSERWAAKRFNLMQWNNFDKGGHFAALEQPDVLRADVQGFFRTIR